MTTHEKIIMTLASFVREKDMDKVLNELTKNEQLILMNICFKTLEIGNNIAYPVSELATKEQLKKCANSKDIKELKENIEDILKIKGK